MNTAAKALSWHGLRRRALSLGAIKGLDQAMQFLLPVVLVRALDTVTFGEYRLLWLAVATVMAAATLNISGSLYFFVPRADAATRRLYIHQTIAFLALAGVVCGFLVSPWNPWLPAPMRTFEKYGLLVPAFVALWVATILLDYLPTIEERIRWQGFATLGVSALRVLVLAAGAWFTGDMLVLLWLLLGVVLIKFALLLAYLRRWHGGLGRPWFTRAAVVEQFHYSVPFGLSSAFFGLRGQADQWVAAGLFSLASFAAFSIGSLVGQVVQLVRQSVIEAFLPVMSRMQAAGDMRSVMRMNSRANVLVGSLLLPLLAFAFAFSEEIVTVVFTAAYVEAAPTMRVYVVGMAAMVVEIGSIVMLLREGGFAMRVAGLGLVTSVTVSWTAAHHIGLAGAAMGSVSAIYLDRLFLLRRVSSRTGIPVRDLQDWRALARILVSAAFAAALAWAVTERFLAGTGHIVRLAAGAALLALIYLPFNLRRDRGDEAQVGN
jgi:O-antigen/teichoic acid export membrane protein